MAKSSAARATIAQVAERAGVSPATVSRVMNGNTAVDESLAEKVRAAARELHYSASPLARSLVTGRTHTIAVVVPDLENPTFQGVLRGLIHAAAQDGYRVLIADSLESADEEQILAVETRRRSDGIVLCAPRMSDDVLHALLGDLSPAVLVNRRETVFGVPTVSADYRSGATALIEHLYSLGHRRIRYLAGTATSESNRARVRGLDDFMSTHPDVVRLDVECGATFADGHRLGDLVGDLDATAVIAYNDLVAMGLLSRLHELGVSVPADVSVAGFDDIPFARYTSPPLTTVAVPVDQLGAEAWGRLRSIIRSELPGADVLLSPSLEVRGTTAAPRE